VESYAKANTKQNAVAVTLVLVRAYLERTMRGSHRVIVESMGVPSVRPKAELVSG